MLKYHILSSYTLFHPSRLPSTTVFTFTFLISTLHFTKSTTILLFLPLCTTHILFQIILHSFFVHTFCLYISLKKYTEQSIIKNFFGSFFLSQRKVPIIISCNKRRRLLLFFQSEKEPPTWQSKGGEEKITLKFFLSFLKYSP